MQPSNQASPVRRWGLGLVLLALSGMGCTRCVRQTTSAEPAETVIGHRDSFGYQRMSTRYRSSHSLADFEAKFRSMPRLSKAKGQISVFASEVTNDGKIGHLRGNVDEPGFEEIQWEADVVNEVSAGEDRWRCDTLTIDGTTLR